MTSDPAYRRRLLVLGTCCLSILVFQIDATVLNVALPAIQRDLHASVAGLQWTVDAYTLVLACFLMLAGSVADRFGRRRAFQAGLAVFSVGSALCGLAPNLGLLIVFRMIQALGGTLLIPVAMSIITRTFADAQERARAIGTWSAVVGISLAGGPPLGGFLVALAGWRSIFWINVPIGLLAIALTRRFVPESRAARPRRLDPVGQVLVTTLLGSLIYGVIELPSQGLSPLVVGLLVAVAALLLYERHRSEPLIDLRFFRSTPFAGATVMAVCALAALGGFLFVNTLYLQNVRGLTALQAGLWMLPTAAMTFAFPPVAGRMINAHGPRLPLVLAGTAMALAGLLFAVLHAGTNLALLFTAYVVFGIGFGLAATPISNAAVVGMPRDQAGLAAAVLSTSHQVGQSSGVAVMGAVLAAAGVGAGHLTVAQFAVVSTPAWAILAGCGATVAVLGIVTTTRRARATAERLAQTFDEPHAASTGVR